MRRITCAPVTAVGGHNLYEKRDMTLAREVIIMENSKGAICQSCGMPMQKEEDFGTNADGSKNREYCNFCFRGGKFVDEGITVEQKIDKVVEIAKTKMNMPEGKARETANNNIPKLKRWQR